MGAPLPRTLVERPHWPQTVQRGFDALVWRTDRHRGVSGLGLSCVRREDLSECIGDVTPAWFAQGPPATPRNSGPAAFATVVAPVPSQDAGSTVAWVSQISRFCFRYSKIAPAALR